MSDLISRQAATQTALDFIVEYLCGAFDEDFQKKLMERMNALPSAQLESISEEYAKAVRTWLINYQVRCAELKGRYTPYEILGWIVSDWRKENEIW